ncbi:diiron oxygenase [Micromonospora sp. L31]|uniref:diiron oxygenase n=1 Tax=Micromonospora sp. L31 TaxID=3452213 RepID=UPI003F8CE7C4
MDGDPANHGSVLRDWDSRSSVRSKPRRILDEIQGGKVPYPIDLTPVASHRLVRGRRQSQVNEILVRRLYLYLDFTTVLEQEIVNPVLVALSKGEAGADLPNVMRLDAYRIYVDEAYHALSSVDLNLQIEAASGVRYLRQSRHRFQVGLVNLLQQRKSIDPRLIMLAAATVSETLISGTLSKIPSDPTVISIIRESIADHADDERHHHAFFAKVHEYVWPRLSESERRTLAPMYGDFVIDFLMPDVPAQIGSLVASGFTDSLARRIAYESLGDGDLTVDARRASRATMALLRRTGVLDYPEAVDHYADLGLIDPPILAA